ncbi:6-carboxytetrahydropterin synthase [Sorangium sp. So ce296]|uniref:6-pyruvoyl trahydropterin synthase family protein n=1 Tax=Sorangium sp. So ce296 TaxID=3133296 RepID=UPI003F63C2E3
MYELTIERFLHVAHALRLYDGKYEPLHCHRWQVHAQVSAERLDAIGGVMDFNELDRLLADAVGTLEGKTLNHLSEFADVNSSSERMAEVLYRKLAPRLPPGVRLDCVTLLRDEAIRARFTYRP